MKNSQKLFLSFVLFALASACQQSKDKPEQTGASHEMDSTEHEHMAKIQSTCTMHPEVVKDEPGKCPKCGMDLVKKEMGEHEAGMDSMSHEL